MRCVLIYKRLFIFLIFLICILVSPQVFASENLISEYNNDGIYISEAEPSIVNYTPGEHKNVSVSTSYPSIINEYEDDIGSFYVYIDKVDGDHYINTPYNYNVHSFDYDLYNLNLTNGIHKVYFGPMPYLLEIIPVAYDFKPLTVIINNGDKLNTYISLDSSSVAIGDTITGFLTDGYNPLTNKEITFMSPDNNTYTVLTDTEGYFSILTNITGIYKDFTFIGDNIYNTYTCLDNVNVTNGKYEIIIDQGIVKYIPGQSCILTGSINYPSSSILWDTLWVWFNGVPGTATPVYTSSDEKVSLSSRTFTIDLSKSSAYLPSTNNYTITFGPQYGANNNAISYNNLSLSLDTALVITGSTKVDTSLIILNDNVHMEDNIIGRLYDSYSGIVKGIVSYTTPSGSTNTVKTDKNGQFLIKTTETGIYKDFTFSGDDAHNPVVSNTEVTVLQALEKYNISLNLKSVNYAIDESLIINGTITYPSNLNLNLDLYYWFKDDVSNARKLETLTKTSNSFSFDLKTITGYTSSTILTIGVLNGTENTILQENNLKGVFSNLTLYIVEKIETRIDFNNTVLSKDETIIAYLLGNNQGLRDKTITYISPSGEKSIITGANGLISILANETGNYTNFTFKGDNQYLAHNSNTIIQVLSDKIPVNITSTSFENNTLNIQLEAEDKSIINEGIIELKINNNTLSTNIINNQATLNLNLPAGIYTGTLQYLGANTYENTLKTISLEIKEETEEILINIPSISAYPKENITIPITIKTLTNTNVKEGTITLTLNNKEYTGTIENGFTEISLTLPEIPGIYTLKATYKNNTYTKTTSTNLTVENINTNPILTINYDYSLKEIKGELKDGNTPINTNITIELIKLSNNQKQTYTTTTTNGDYNLPLNLEKGEYSAIGKYENQSSKIYIVISDTIPNTILKDTSDLLGVYGTPLNFTGELKDTNGGTLVGYHLSLNLTRLSSGASKTYYLTSDYTGKYTLPINLAPGQYTIRTSINDNNYTGESFSTLIILENTTNTENITLISLNQFNNPYLSGASLTGTLNTYNSRALAGQHISLTLSNTRGASKTYDVVTDYNGVFSLPINLAPGTYYARCTFNGIETYKPSTTSSTLTVY